jgi:hypothetical protein
MASVHQLTKFVSCLWILSSRWLPIIAVIFVALTSFCLSYKPLADMYDTKLCSPRLSQAYCTFLLLLSASFKHNLMFICCFVTTKKNMLYAQDCCRCSDWARTFFSLIRSCHNMNWQKLDTIGLCTMSYLCDNVSPLVLLWTTFSWQYTWQAPTVCQGRQHAALI